MVEALPKLSNVSHAAFSGRWGSARPTVLGAACNPLRLRVRAGAVPRASSHRAGDSRRDNPALDLVGDTQERISRLSRARRIDSGANIHDESAVVRDFPQDPSRKFHSSRTKQLGFVFNTARVRARSCFHPYAARIAETLLRVARDEQPIFQGLVHSVAALLDTRAFAQRPGVSLAEA